MTDTLVPDPNDQTPWQNRNGIWYKREDLHRHPVYGVNGSKYRAARYLLRRAKADGARTVVSAASVKAPQTAIVSVLAAEEGMGCHVIIGGTTVEKALPKHASLKVAHANGATFSAIPIGYNAALQKAGRDYAEAADDTWLFPYGATTPPGTSVNEVRDFVSVGSDQVKNIPIDVRTLVVPFGSGNTAARVIYGLLLHGVALDRLVLIGIGPDRMEWLRDRLARLGADLESAAPVIDHVPLYPWFATYEVSMRETLDGIEFHPTYEGKVVRFLNMMEPDWWAPRDGTTGFWIVGGPLP